MIRKDTDPDFKFILCRVKRSSYAHEIADLFGRMMRKYIWEQERLARVEAEKKAGAQS
jgi:hypothetical protein